MFIFLEKLMLGNEIEYGKFLTKKCFTKKKKEILNFFSILFLVSLFKIYKEEKLVVVLT